eukprot:2686700-Rhodomonas_salina.3
MLLYPGATATGGQIPSFVPWAVSEVGMGFLGIPTGAAVNMGRAARAARDDRHGPPLCTSAVRDLAARPPAEPVLFCTNQ